MAKSEYLRGHATRPTADIGTLSHRETAIDPLPQRQRLLRILSVNGRELGVANGRVRLG